jgi:cytochrome c-type biogenesis protein CcsB
MLCLAASACAMDVSALRPLPTLDNGRIKPIDTLSRQLVRFVTGKERFNGIDPLEMVLRWQADPADWEGRAILHVPNLELRNKVSGGAQWMSPASLRADKSFAAWVASLEQKQADAEKLGEEVAFDKLETAALELEHRLMAFDAARDGRSMAIVPIAGRDDRWLTVSQLGAAPELASVRQDWLTLVGAVQANDGSSFNTATKSLIARIRELHPGYAEASRIDREVTYNAIHPFRWTWIAYGVAVIALVGTLMLRARLVYVAALSLLGMAVAMHIGAFALRCSITGWAPVTNMYETIVWVALISAALSLVLEFVYRSKTLALAGAVAAMIGGVIADVMPPSLGHDIGNLTPVLRSNYWLTIHVLTIVSSYAAMALACVLGNIVLGQMLLQGRRSAAAGPASAARVASQSQHLVFIYRSIQVGVLLLAAGTILGGLWADQSWGRFWGWDPKEVWALIALLTYLALLHGRFAGWIGRFGLAAGSVICFSTVLMSWYGVNFVLGAGLHSYGFGTGGQGYVATYVLAQLAFVAIAWMSNRRNEPATESNAVSEMNLVRAES